jgi:hypothetical protein
MRGTRSILDGMPSDGMKLLRLLWQRRDGSAQIRAAYIADLRGSGICAGQGLPLTAR